MTINAPAAIMLAFYVVAAEEHGRPGRAPGGHDPGRHPQGVHRAEGVVLPGRPGDAAAGRHDRVVLRARMPRWHPVSISGYHIREAGSTAAQELAFTLKDGLTYVEQAVDARARRRRLRAAAELLLQRAHRLLRGDRQAARGAADLGARAARHASARADPQSLADAHARADGGRVADGAAAAQQHRAHGDRGARRRARRHPVAAHELLRRGARAADRGGGADRAADAADHRARDRRGEHDRPARRLVLRRGADRPDGGAAPTSTSPRSTSSAGWSRRSSAASRSARSPTRRSSSRREIDAGELHRQVGVNALHRGRRRARLQILRIDPALERKQIGRVQARPRAPRRRGRRGGARRAQGRRPPTSDAT